MAARAYWQGQIRLALVSIPVQVFSATKSGSRISFNQIHRPSGKRIRYEKVAPGIGPVDAADIVKGYEVEKGRYVFVEDDEIDNVKLEAKRTIDLIQFVDAEEIDDIYLEKPFYVSPDEDEVAGEAYVVLRDALKATKKVGLGQMVVRGRGDIVALKPYGKGLMIETLRYADEVQGAEGFYTTVPGAKPEPELLSLAKELITRKVAPFNPKLFKDAYDDALRALINAKVENRPLEQIEEPQIGAQVINLMEALKRSVGGGAARRPAPASGASESATVTPVTPRKGAKSAAKGPGKSAAKASPEKVAKSKDAEADKPAARRTGKGRAAA
ncbi:MAG: Ku protein [Bauldia sp.]